VAVNIGDPGQILIQGFQTGLSVKRNIEETAKLIREREEAEASQRAIADAFAKRKKIDEELAFSEASAKDKVGRLGDGHQVSDADLNTAIREYHEKAIARAQHYSEIAEDLFATGLPTAIETGKQLHAQAVLFAQGLEAHVNNQQQSADVRRGQDVEAGTRIATQAMSDAATGERQTAADKAAMERTQAQNQSQERIQASQNTTQLKIHGVDPNDPITRLKQMTAKVEAVAALEGAGLTEDQINRGVGGGFNAAEFKKQWQGMSDEKVAQVKQSQQRIKRLEERRDKGEDVGDLITAEKEELAALLKEEDQLMDTEIRSRQYRRNTPLARRVAAGLVSAERSAEKGSLGFFKGANELLQSLAEVTGARAEDLVPPPNPSAREFDAPPKGSDTQVIYPDKDGTYSDGRGSNY
jgi:hypothetical protein